MKHPSISSLWALCSLCLALPVSAQQPVKIIGERSQIRFVTKQMNAPVEGVFRKFNGTVAFDPANPPATKADFTVDLGSIDLHSEEGETEVKRKLWLDVPGFPNARFTTTSVKALGNNRFEARGQLTIKGTSREVTAPFTMIDANRLRTVDGQFTLKRLQFRIGEGQWADTDTVADDIVVHFRFTIPVA